MKQYAQPVAKSVELALCDLILTSAEEEEKTPDLGDVQGGKTDWNDDLWTFLG